MSIDVPPGAVGVGVAESGDTDMIDVVLGVVQRAHGLTGEVVVGVHTDVPERRFVAGAVVYPATADRLTAPADLSRSAGLTVESARWHGPRLLVRFAEAPDRTAAEALSGTVLWGRVDPAETTDAPDEFYDHQLRGLRATSPTGTPVGQVADVLHLPSQDILVVTTAAGDRWVPFVADLVPTVDLAAGHVVIADLPGLLNDGAEAVRDS